MMQFSRKLGAVSLIVLLGACSDQCEDTMDNYSYTAPAPQVMAAPMPGATPAPSNASAMTPAPALAPAASVAPAPAATPAATPAPVVAAAPAPVASPFRAPASAALAPAPVAAAPTPAPVSVAPVAAAPAAVAAPAVAGAKPLVVIRFQNGPVGFKPALKEAVSKAEQLRPGLHYDIASYVPVSDANPAETRRQAALALKNQRAVTEEMMKLGVPASRITIRSVYTPVAQMAEQEAHIFVN